MTPVSLPYVLHDCVNILMYQTIKILPLLKVRVAELQAEADKAQEATAGMDKFMAMVHKHTSFEELTPTLLREFVEKIVVHEAVCPDGKRRGKNRRQEIEIYYSFIGKLELPD